VRINIQNAGAAVKILERKVKATKQQAMSGGVQLVTKYIIITMHNLWFANLISEESNIYVAGLK